MTLVKGQPFLVTTILKKGISVPATEQLLRARRSLVTLPTTLQQVGP